jgi:predicted RNA-binding Zn-ribbon protein involved in translation (DUF1610 family)
LAEVPFINKSSLEMPWNEFGVVTSADSKIIKKQQYLLYICYILLLQASNIELNPGPNITIFPCNICGNEVDWDQKAVACDNCSDWYHTSCTIPIFPVFAENVISGILR